MPIRRWKPDRHRRVATDHSIDSRDFGSPQLSPPTPKVVNETLASLCRDVRAVDDLRVRIAGATARGRRRSRAHRGPRSRCCGVPARWAWGCCYWVRECACCESGEEGKVVFTVLPVEPSGTRRRCENYRSMWGTGGACCLG